MKLNLQLLLSLLLGMTYSSLGQTEISLASWFGNGMVLQRSATTLLQGTGPANKTLTVELRIGNKTWGSERGHWPALVDATGHWRLAVDLTPASFRQTSVPWTLRIDDKKNRREYTNIFIGDIIILAGWEDQGIAAGIEEFISETSKTQLEHGIEAVRFLDLTQPNAINEVQQTQGPEWEGWPEEVRDLNRYSTLTLRLAYELAESKIPDLSTNGYVGIVLARKNFVENGLDSTGIAKHQGEAPVNAKIWQWITEDARKAQRKRSETLILNKRQNIVTNIPPVKDYDPALTYAAQAFDPEKPPLRWFSFVGAICSSPRQTAPN